MKKHLFLTALVLALVMCFSLGVCAHEQGNVVTMGEDDPNQYEITAALDAYAPTADLWIGTLKDWKDAGYTLGDTGTALVNGEALHEDDIIMTNGKVLISLAVGTRNPWGYPAGSVLDAGRVDVVDGKYVGKRDTIWAAEVLVNGWDSWAPNNCGVVTFDLVRYDFNAKAEVKEGGLPAVKVDRDYLIDGMDFSIVTYYSMEKDAEYAYMFTVYTNNGEKTGNLSNRFAMTNKGDDGGAMFGGDVSSTVGAYSGMVASYGKTDKNTFFTALIMPGNVERFNAKTGEKLDGVVEPARVGGSVGYKCVRVDSKGNFKGGENHAFFEQNETRTYGLYLFIDDASTPEGALNLIAEIEDAEMIDVAGTAPANATIVVKLGGKSFGWYEADKDGNFAFQLPASENEYTAYVETNGKDHGETVVIPAEGAEDLVLAAGADKIAITINLKDQNGKAVYGKVEVPNAYPTVRYNGNSVYNAPEAGKVVVDVPADCDHVVVYGQGYWFYSEPQELAIEAGKTEYTVTVDMKVALGKGMLSGDVHHHGDKNDAFAAVEDLVPSIAASDIDVMFVTDHDFTTNNLKAYKLASDYGVEGFVPSEEISCSWAHFNVLPYDEEGYKWFLDENADNAETMDQFADLKDFVAQTHEHHAYITANHPWYSYGLFTAQDNGAIPGGYTDEYDNVEINACNLDSETSKTIASMAELWTGFLNGYTFMDTDVVTEKPHYLVGGSDTHDVIYPGFSADYAIEKGNYDNVRAKEGTWYATGKVRTIAYVGDVAEKDLMANGIAFNNAVAAGNSYVTFGPIIQLTEDNLPGEYYNGKEFEVSFEVESLETISEILVLTEDAEGTYKWSEYDDANNGTTEALEVANVDLEGSLIGAEAVAKGLKDGVFSYSMDVEAGETTWVTFIVVDENDNFAITNPYWVGNTFDDVAFDAWYFQAVTALQEAGIVNGYEDGTFGPDGQVTRAEFATMMYRSGAAGEAVGKANTFSDVAEGKWYAEAVNALAAAGIVNGYGNGTFNPNGLITRAEMAQMIYKALGEDAYFEHGFVDVQPSSWYYNAVTVLYAYGIINGMGDGTFQPTANATRAQSAQILYNVLY